MKRKNDLLINQMLALQEEYKALLIKLREMLLSDLKLGLDTIAVFWYKNKDFVEFALSCLHKEYEAIIFTAGTYLRIDENEHYPLLTFGTIHIIDDPACIFITMLQEVDKNFKAELLESILATIENNIKAIGRHENLFVLPVRYCFETKYGRAIEESEKAFLEQFKDIKTWADFFALKTYDDISQALLPGVESSLFFWEEDDNNKALKERLENYVNAEDMPPSLISSPAMTFCTAVFSRLMQAINILKICFTYGTIPFIRDITAFYYLNVVLDSFFSKDNNCQLFKNRMNICYSYSHSFDSSYFQEISFNKYMESISAEKIEQLWNDSRINSLTDLKEITESILKKEILHS